TIARGQRGPRAEGAIAALGHIAPFVIDARIHAEDHAAPVAPAEITRIEAPHRVEPVAEGHLAVIIRAIAELEKPCGPKASGRRLGGDIGALGQAGADTGADPII